MKSKELFAYLIYCRGASCTLKEIAAVLFEDMVYDDRQRDYAQKIISAMMNRLKKAGAESAVIKSYNSLSVDVSCVECDYYMLDEFRGKDRIQYTGEFMGQYSWAEDVAGYLSRIYEK